MGTTGIPGQRGTHAEIDRELMRGWSCEDGTVVTMTDCRLTFTAHYHVRRENGVPIVIIATLIHRYRANKRTGTPVEWTYKDMSEDMGPYMHDCPLDLFAIVPEPVAGERGMSAQSAIWAAEWRAKVRDFHAKRQVARARAKTVEVGSIVRLVEGLKVAGTGRVTRFKGKTIVAVFEDGREYRVAPRYIAAVEGANA